MTEKAKEKAVNYLAKTFKICASYDFLLSTNPGKAFTNGYAEGYADGLEVEKMPSDEMLRKIIYHLDKGYYISSEFNSSNYGKLVEYLKEKLSKE